MFVRNGSLSCRVRKAMTTSSRAALPARSPRPLIVHSTCRAPASTAASEFATARPRSLWQCTLITACRMFFTCSIRYRMIPAYSEGNEYPTVSGMFTVVAPASIAASTTAARNGSSVRLASSGLNSTSSTNVRASFTPSTLILMISSSARFSLYLRWISLVAQNTWIRGFSAPLTASPARTMSLSMHRASPATLHRRMIPAISCTASKSSGEAIGKPASIMSTPRASSARAISIFSLRFSDAPGHCSPSRSVVSKIRMGWTCCPSVPVPSRSMFLTSDWTSRLVPGSLVGWLTGTSPYKQKTLRLSRVGLSVIPWFLLLYRSGTTSESYAPLRRSRRPSRRVPCLATIRLSLDVRWHIRQ